MINPTPDLADIDAAIAKREWWLRLLEELAEAGMELAGALVEEVTEARVPASVGAHDFERISAAVQRAVATSVRLEADLRGLTALRARKAREIAAAKGPAQADARPQAQVEAVAGDEARVRAKARREARKEKVRELVMMVIDSEAADREDHERLSLALDQRLSLDPAFVDTDGLALRETVIRICADLGITPDWRRWEAGNWKPRNPTFQSDRPIPPPNDPSAEIAGGPDHPIPPTAPHRRQ